MGMAEEWADGYGVGPAPVASFAANAFGLFDVHGNLNEWCRAAARPAKESKSPIDRYARGGNFGGAAAHARSAYRLNVGSGESPGANKGFGFRPSIELPVLPKANG